MDASNGKAPEDIGQARLTYAWEWFKYHASQRVSMFNYFLIITGIFATAYFGLLKEGASELMIHGGRVLGIVGALTAVGFIMLDVRNKALVDRGSAVLEQLEKDALFGGNEPRLAGGPAPWVIFRHTGWIRGIELFIASIFVIATIYAEPIAHMARITKSMSC